MTPRPISARNETRPGYGGPVGRNLRPGTRWAWDIALPPMSYEESLLWDDLLEEGDTVVMEILQPGLDLGAPGAPLVNGAMQSGRMLTLKGLTPGYLFRKGQWLSVISQGQRYAYKSRADATADGAGNLVVPLRTMIRYPLVNNAVVEIAKPKVEGWATPDPDSFKVGADGLVSPRFTIEERE
nr:hypothetical protein [Brevundimonas diminuta]